MSSVVALKHLVSLVPGQSPPSEEVSDFDGAGLPFLQGNAEFGLRSPTPIYECDAASRRCKRGDVLISVRAPVGALNLADRAYGIGRGLCAVRAERIEPAFLWWLLRARVDELISVATGSTYDAITGEDIGRLRVQLPPGEAQRAIAGFLETETTRIDGLAARKRRLLELAIEREESAIIQVFARWSRVPLRRLARRIDVGIAEAATHAYADEGVALIRSTNIRSNRLDVRDLLRIQPWFAERNRSKYLNAGDILTVRTGGAGVSAVVPPELHRSQCFTQLITTLEPGQLPDLICVALNSGDARAYFERAGWGSAQANISVPLLAAAPVPEVPVSEQRAVLTEVRHILDVSERLRSALGKQIDLLAERREALVTAAVMGEFAFRAGAA